LEETVGAAEQFMSQAEQLSEDTEPGGMSGKLGQHSNMRPSLAH
jgi:hypothetical protein